MLDHTASGDGRHQIPLAPAPPCVLEAAGSSSATRIRQNIINLLRKNNLPAAEQVLKLTSGEYRASVAGVDLLSLISAWRDLLQVELQIAQIESELGKTLASLERAVGAQFNEHPPEPASHATPTPDRTPAPSPSGSPFRPDRVEPLKPAPEGQPSAAEDLSPALLDPNPPGRAPGPAR